MNVLNSKLHYKCQEDWFEILYYANIPYAVLTKTDQDNGSYETALFPNKFLGTCNISFRFELNSELSDTVYHYNMVKSDS